MHFSVACPLYVYVYGEMCLYYYCISCNTVYHPQVCILQLEESLHLVLSLATSFRTTFQC